MSRRLQKKQIFSKLENGSWPEVQEYLDHSEDKHLINHLFSAICSTNAACKWHAVSGFGRIVPKIASMNVESARIVMRRFLWSLNDESGGIGWGAPESMAEVMVHSDQLFDEYCHMLLSYAKEDGPELCQDCNFIELPALQQGVLWGIARLLACKNEKMLEREIEDDLVKYLDSDDMIVRGYALICLSYSKKRFSIDAIAPLLTNQYTFSLYWENVFKNVCISDIAKKILQ